MSTPTPNIAVADLKREPSWHQLGYVTDLLVATQYGKTIDQTLFTWDAPNIVSVAATDKNDRLRDGPIYARRADQVDDASGNRAEISPQTQERPTNLFRLQDFLQI